MRTDNVVQRKSYDFAVRIVRLCRHLALSRKEYILTKQLLRCGATIGANIEEAIGAQSRSDFIAKISIAYKEARETSYWIRLLSDTEYLTPRQFTSIHRDAVEIGRIVSSILNSSKKPRQM